MTVVRGERVNQLLGRLFQEPDLLRRFQEDRNAVFQEAGLTEQEIAALRDGSFTALASIGVHPVLRMHYQMAANPTLGSHVTIKEFLDQLPGKTHHG